MAANKVRYNLKNVYYAKMVGGDVATDGTATYSTPVKWPGAVSISLDPEGETSPFYADGIVYFQTNANNGYSGDLEMALIPDAFRRDIMGDVMDSNGVMIENKDAAPIHFALLFEFDGDQKAIKHVLYNCVVARASIEGETIEDTIEPGTETLTLTATSVYNAALATNIVKARSSESTDATAYAQWASAVYQPSAPSASYTVSFESNGGSSVASQSVVAGGTATEPVDPTQVDFEFAGWYTEAALTHLYDFTTPVYSNTTLYAKWVAET